MSFLEQLYDTSSFIIAVVLFVLILLVGELAFRLGRYVRDQSDAEVKSLTGAVQASILALLGLLLGFTFSMSMSRHDARSHALIDEVNAIGTASLRTQLLPPELQEDAHALFRRYVDLRVTMGETDLTKREQRDRLNASAAELQGELWSVAMKAADVDPRQITSGAFVASMNAMIDGQGKRNALLWLQVPVAVWFVLFVAFLFSGAILGYASGLSGRRIRIPMALISLLISLVVFLVIDLDRPKRGIIQVDRSTMVDLQESLR